MAAVAAVVDDTMAVESSKGAAAACRNFSGADLALRALLFAVTLAGLVVLATANQTALIPVPQIPGLVLSRAAKFNYFPVMIYLLVALCVTCFYSLLTGLTSLKLISGSPPPTKTIFLLVVLDLLYTTIMASATGGAGGVGWIALEGATHTNWNKICDPYYGKLCRHIGSSIILGLVASIILVLLTILNAHSLYRCMRQEAGGQGARRRPPLHFHA